MLPQEPTVEVLLFKDSSASSVGRFLNSSLFLMLSIDSQSCMLVPLSNLARSIGIHFSVGVFGIDGSNCTIIEDEDNPSCRQMEMFSGLRVSIQVSSFFRLISTDTTTIEIGSEEKVLRVIYTNCICLDIDPRESIIDESPVFGVPSPGGLNGKLSFQMYLNV